ncbi:hypothetical protein PR202_ga22883 [Eleusine coracana subsp. coracana]|uniref:Uncharacterized protein n=1 Tax=Eleusine coracana subsp. coracana TaxID=191504 RepID=A0AAV5D4D2_ELECO|nr:hypothetical protein PR202_ga22883 [Eleusine coracana subsp. coracana]
MLHRTPMSRPPRRPSRYSSISCGKSFKHAAQSSAVRSGALHKAVQCRKGAHVHASRREPPRAVGRPLGRVAQQREQEEPAVLCKVLSVHQEGDSAVVARGVEEVQVGEAEEAGIVVHGGVLVERTDLLRVLEGAVDAGGAIRRVYVPTTERKGIDSVRARADDSGGEEGRVGRGILWEGCR